MVNQISTLLQLSSDDIVLDLCCGNGLITRQVAEEVKQIVGMDFSAGLINTARTVNHAPNIEYVQANVMTLTASQLSLAEKCYIHESLMYFTPESLSELLQRLTMAGITRIVLAGIPDADKIWDFYNTPEKQAYYHQCEQAQRPHMGHWWLQHELAEVALKCGFQPRFSAEHPALQTAYFRFDCVLEKYPAAI
jgi:trans-aconitate methyltransferase